MFPDIKIFFYLADRKATEDLHDMGQENGDGNFKEWDNIGMDHFKPSPQQPSTPWRATAPFQLAQAMRHSSKLQWTPGA